MNHNINFKDTAIKLHCQSIVNLMNFRDTAIVAQMAASTCVILLELKTLGASRNSH